MSDIATKLTYLNETKSQLKDMINYGLPTENQITNETTFRNYVKGIFEAFLESLRDSTTLYTNLPKISGNGTQITLNDTANAPMRITLGSSALSQDAAPTPDSPQDIHTISGNNSVVVEGKNLCENIRNTTTTAKYQNAFKVKAKFKPNTYYEISFIDNSIGNSYYRNENLFSNFTSYDITSTGTRQFYGIKTKDSFDYESDGYVTIFKNYKVQDNVAQFHDVDIREVQSLTTDSFTFEPYVSQTSPINLPVENLLPNFTFTDETKNGLTLTNNGDGSFTITGTSTTPTSWVTFRKDFGSSNFFTLKAGTYTIPRISLGIYRNNTFVFNGGDTFTLDEDSEVRYMQIAYKTSSAVNETYWYQLEKGTKVNSYTPYGTTPIEYCKIGNYEDEFILTSGKNLFDKDNIIENKRLNGSGVAQSDNGYYVSSFIKVEPNTKYIKNSPSVDAYHRFSYYSSDNESSFISNADSNTATTPSNCQYLRFCGLLTEINTTQLNKGETLLPYEPYGTNQWYLKKNIGKVVLDGSETITTFAQYPNMFQFNNLPDNLSTIYIGRIDSPLYCNYFSKQTSGDVLTNQGFMVYWSGGTQFIRLNHSDYTDKTAFATWLSTHNTDIYYILGSPTYTQITGELETQLNNIYEKLLSYKGTTNISQVNNDLPFVLGVSAIQDLE